jgi:hypothetical protein
LRPKEEVRQIFSNIGQQIATEKFQTLLNKAEELEQFQSGNVSVAAMLHVFS